MPITQEFESITKEDAPMAVPGYTAEASLYVTGRLYRGTSTPGSSAGAMVVAQQGTGCTVSCDDWISCNQECGQWPPGLSNYECWLDCLKPTVDCLNGPTCFGGPPPPPACCPSARPHCCGSCARGKCNGTCIDPLTQQCQ